MNAPADTPLAQAVIAQAVQGLESTGWLDDAGALRQAAREKPGERPAQYLRRAWLLGERLGLTQALEQARAALGLALIALALAVALAALGLERAALGAERTINAAAALAALLGPHLLALAVWLAALMRPWRRPQAGGGALLGQMAWRLSRQMAQRIARRMASRASRRQTHSGANAARLLDASAAVLQRLRLWPWLLGGISHGIWALAFALALALLLFDFAFRAYSLTWETTILSSHAFAAFVQASGWLPAQLGFTVPGDAAVQQALAASAPASATLASSAAAANQSAWAWWLMGCVFTYGLLPRALLAAFCLWRWRQGLGRLVQPDAALPEGSPEAELHVRQVFARLDALAPAVVMDAERPAPDRKSSKRSAHAASAAPALIGFELPPELPWPPALPAGPALRILNVDGSSTQRQAALDELAARPPAALLLACHASASPDRGAARFLREAARHAPRTALWLVPADEAAQAGHAARWQNWLRAEKPGAALLASKASALAWLQKP
ncbi:MAG: DUF2868 domain-containing protein [Ottowia sp.]